MNEKNYEKEFPFIIFYQHPRLTFQYIKIRYN